uniref:Major antigen-like n=1 Tax=Haemonchus contortus TaxID=6289 RepID=W6NEP7_HAECO
MSTIVLDARTIVEVLSCFKVGINVEDIIHPSPDRVQNIYRAFCMEIMNVPERSLNELPFECQFSPDMADMNQKSGPLLLLFTTLRCFFMDFGDPNMNFTMCDLINPQPKRTRKLFSIIADYTTFYQKASQVFESTSSEYDNARKVIEEGMEQVRLAEERKNALRSDRDSRKRRENGLLAESGKKNAILTELMKEAQASESRRDEIVKLIEDGKQEIVKGFAEIEALKSEIQHHSKAIVKSPERVRNDVDEQREQIKRLQEQCDTERQRIVNNNASMSVIEQASKLIDERFKELERLRSFQADVEVLDHECANALEQVAEANKYKTRKEEALNRLVKSGQEEEISHRRALEAYSSRLQDLKLKKMELTNTIKELRESASVIRDESAQLQKEMVRLRNERTEETKRAREYCLELRRRFVELLRKYREAQMLFHAQAASFVEAVQNVSTGLDDLEPVVRDLNSLSLSD